MNIIKIEVDVYPKTCHECTMCIFDAEHYETRLKSDKEIVF